MKRQSASIVQPEPRRTSFFLLPRDLSGLLRLDEDELLEGLERFAGGGAARALGFTSSSSLSESEPKRLHTRHSRARVVSCYYVRRNAQCTLAASSPRGIGGRRTRGGCWCLVMPRIRVPVISGNASNRGWNQTPSASDKIKRVTHLDGSHRLRPNPSLRRQTSR